MEDYYNFVSCIDKSFDPILAKNLYDWYKYDVMGDREINFDEFIKTFSPFIFSVNVNNIFTGILYVHDWDKDGKFCYISGMALRKSHRHVINAVKILCEHLKAVYKVQQIYSQTRHKHASFALKKIGFTKVNDNTFRYNEV
jgi:hypothetical protein